MLEDQEKKEEKKKVLVVDDEEEMLDILRDKISEAGFQVYTAKDGEEGLALALKEKPDLILLDVIMPRRNGLEMLADLRKDEWGKDAHVILLTVVGDMQTVSQAVEEGSDEYLIKTDWKIADVVEKIKRELA